MRSQQSVDRVLPTHVQSVFTTAEDDGSLEVDLSSASVSPSSVSMVDDGTGAVLTTTATNELDEKQRKRLRHRGYVKKSYQKKIVRRIVAVHGASYAATL
jgi:hypothetical protein